MRRGFTLIELLIVMAVIGTLASFTLVASRTGGDKAYDTQRKSDLKQYQAALEVYANANSNKYPPVGNGSLVSLCDDLELETCPRNSLGDYHYLPDSTLFNYYIWTELATKTDTAQAQYFVICSNGKVDDIVTSPSGNTCPL